MGITAIKRVVNNSRFTVEIANLENPNKFRNGGTVNPNSSLAVDIWIPWAATMAEFRNHHIIVEAKQGTRLVRRFEIHQRADVDGDFVRMADVRLDGSDSGFVRTHIGGLANVDGDRRMIISATGDISLQRI